MDRRSFSATLIAGAASSLLLGTAKAQTAAAARNVVLVHGAYADGSCWSEVVGRLQRMGLRVTAVQNPRYVRSTKRSLVHIQPPQPSTTRG